MKYLIALMIFVALVLIFAGNKPATVQENVLIPIKKEAKSLREGPVQLLTQPLLIPGFVPSQTPSKVRDKENATVIFMADINQARAFAEKKLREAKMRADVPFNVENDGTISATR